MRRSLPTCVWALGLCGIACGPSFGALRESEVRFEHCNRLDLDPDVGDAHRERCWQDWEDRYTYGQTKDRVEHARQRVRELSGQAGPEPPQPTLDQEVAAANAAPKLPADECTKVCAEHYEECGDTCATAPTGCAGCNAEYRQCMKSCFEEEPEAQPTGNPAVPERNTKGR